MSQRPSFDLEKEAGGNFAVVRIAGVDEVGRGALAGPLVAAAVVFDQNNTVEMDLWGVTDSKRLTSKQREELVPKIKSLASNFAFGIISVEEVDRWGVGAANVMAFKRALDGLGEVDLALIDGRRFRGFDRRYLCVEKGESKSLSIAAASVIAKVYRDELMTELAKEFPEYDFAGNKGYASARHIEALKKYGPSPHHRQSFLGFIIKPEVLL
ncbi:MAG: ribonuclease HII [Patescibacteria group bacterium]